MRVALTDRFRADVRDLGESERAAVFEVLLALPDALGAPHAHAGAGIRRLHASGVWEARVGLGLRLVFTFAEGTLTLVRAGTHDDVKRFVRSLR